MNFLDMRSVMMVYMFSNAICVGVMIILWIQNNARTPGLKQWVWGFIFLLVAIPLLALRNLIPDFFSIIIGNLMILLGIEMILMGLEKFTGKPSRQVHNWLFLCLIFLLQIFFTYFQPSLLARKIIFSVALMVISFQCAWLLLHRVEKEMRSQTQTTGIVFLGYSLFSFARILVDLSIPQPEDLLQSSSFDALIILIFQMLTIIITFSLFLLVNRRLLYDLERDIENRKKVEQALANSEEKFAKAFHNHPDAIVISSLKDGKIIEVNESFFHITGYSKPEILGKTTIELNLWEKASDRKVFVKCLQKEGQIQHREATFRRKTGRLFPGLVSADLMQIAGEKFVITVVQDISDRKQAEEKILANNERLQALTDILQHKSDSIQGFLDYALEQALAMTKSQLGYIYFYNEKKREFTLNTWSREVMKECSIQDPQTIYQLDKTGIWGEAVRQRKPIVLNDYQATHPLKKGYPKGHAHLKNFMTIPVINNDRIVAVIGMANKPDDYNDTDVLQLMLLMGSVWKIVEQRLTEKALHDSETELKALFSSMQDVVITFDHEGHYLKVATTGSQLLINPPEELIGKSIHDIFPREIADRWLTHIQIVIETQTTKHIEYSLKVDGREIWFDAAVSPLDENAVIWVARDITERKRMEEKSYFIGTHDQLTGAFNRTYFDEELKRLEHSRKYPITFLMLDVDNLKGINDSLGHAAGDKLLQLTARVLGESIRAEDIYARIGGDEFVAILPATDQAAAAIVQRRFFQSVEKANKDQAVKLKISIGLATCLAGGSLTDTLKKADAQMYQNKRLKKNKADLADGISSMVG